MDLDFKKLASIVVSKTINKKEEEKKPSLAERIVSLFEKLFKLLGVK